MASNSENVINHIRKRKKDLISLFGSKCCICGFNSFQEALEFHHINPDLKEFGICGSNAATKALEKQIIEARKCVLLCSNCHRGVHAGYLQIPLEDNSIFLNEEVARKLLQENDEIKHGKRHYCQRCGKLISSTAKYCLNCSSLMKRKVDRPSREELKNLIRNTPFTQIGQFYSVSDNAVRKWCKAYNLPHKREDIKNINNEDWFKI